MSSPNGSFSCRLSRRMYASIAQMFKIKQKSPYELYAHHTRKYLCQAVKRLVKACRAQPSLSFASIH